MKAPVPSDKDEVQSFLGPVKYYLKFVRILLVQTIPVLRKKGTIFLWKDDCNQALNFVKEENARLPHWGTFMSVAVPF